MKSVQNVWFELTESLPEHLAERVRVLQDAVRVPDASMDALLQRETSGTHVVCWLHHAIRAHENPALDVARVASAALGLPLIVYQGLGGRHRFNSDRHHTFIMEGAREFAANLRALDANIRFVFNLQRDPELPSPLSQLCARAALVVTEDFPAPPFPQWTQRLAARCGRPFWMVDSACVVPMQLVVGEHLKAFRFRGKTEKLFKARAGVEWPEVRVELADASNIELGFVPLDLDQADIPSLCASCLIDHSVAPVGHTRGGSHAGYKRWDAFKAKGLKNYHKVRNRAEIERESMAVSRMSAYIHHGHVSPLRIVRDTWSLFKTGFAEGAEKYIDEVWVWRELAHHLCFRYSDVLESSDIIPGWAKSTLHAHKDDPRDVKSWEMLARGRAGDLLWDAAERSLLAHGELHNNIRMTWGKAIVGWSDSPRRAQQMLIDLNHRFALDGNNPNSYGGLLWCLGVLDRPFEGVDAPVTGCLRPRPLHDHAVRMDLGKYTKAMNATSWGSPLRVAVVGGGMAGMAAARTLADQNADVVVFDKARGAGGRMSTRRHDDLWFDHGAQYFTTKDDRFERLVESWVHDGIAGRWLGRIGQLNAVGTNTEKLDDRVRYVGIPGMNAVVRHLVGTLGDHGEVRFGVRVVAAHFAEGRWSLKDDKNADLGTFDAVIVALPAPQAADLLIDSPNLRDQALLIRMRPCWSVMVSFDARVPIDFDGIFVNLEGGPTSAPLSWVARDSSKPERPPRETWVLHASPGWSEANIERDKREVAQELLNAFFEVFGIPALLTVTLEAHLWKFANTDQRTNEGCLFDRERLIAACGDWANGGRVEGAYLSGIAAAGSVLGKVVQQARERPRS